MNAAPLLSIQNLKITFRIYEGVVQAVDDVTLDIGPGETVGLVGESGCGKSVTALSILQLLPRGSSRIEGRILFNGRNLAAAGESELRSLRGNAISMIFQEPMTSLNPVLTVGRQIEEAIMLHQGLSLTEARIRAVDMLRLVQIPAPEARAREYPHRLSGGMRQRAMIAMALSCRPRLLLADEPTTALDVTIQAQILELMEDLKEKLGMAILLITHDLGLIAQMASRVIVMYAGQVIEEGPVTDLFHDPLHPYTRGLLGSIPVLGRKFTAGRRQLEEIPGTVPSLFAMPRGCRFNLRCPHATDICREKQPPMIHLAPHRRVMCWLKAGQIRIRPGRGSHAPA
jgi:oligopeptide/dipeptide ABC transporter ATP-binding protein